MIKLNNQKSIDFFNSFQFFISKYKKCVQIISSSDPPSAKFEFNDFSKIIVFFNLALIIKENS